MPVNLLCDLQDYSIAAKKEVVVFSRIRIEVAVRRFDGPSGHWPACRPCRLLVSQDVVSQLQNECRQVVDSEHFEFARAQTFQSRFIWQ